MFKEEAKVFDNRNFFGQFKNGNVWLQGGFGPILKKV
jgi:hypothetical protein